jgi:predicted nucleotidyltransferase
MRDDGSLGKTEYRRLVERLVEAARADDRIQAVLVYGSHARGDADAFSDLDIGVVTADGAYDDLLTRREELLRSLGEPLLLEDFGNPVNLHAILADGAVLEFIIHRESDLVLELPHRVLLDKAGVVERARQRRPAPAEPAPSAEDIARRLRAFWHDVDHLITALGRGDTWWAYGQLDELRRGCLNLARLDAGLPLEDEAYWKIDAALPAERLAALRGTVAPPEIRPMLTAASALLDLYRDLARSLAAKHGMPYPAELDRLMANRLSAVEATLSRDRWR